MKKQLILGAMMCAFVTPALADTKETTRPSDHAPIGVMGDHTHNEGEWMLSYRYSSMEMQGNRVGHQDVSTATVLGDFMVAPTKMTMKMHMVGAMYGVTDDFTLMAMTSHVEKDMDHVNRMGVHFSTKASGVGDTSLSGLYKFYETDTRSWHLNLGLSLPTGSIEERDSTPVNNNAKLPYAMQLGSGTYDPFVGVTYNQTFLDNWAWGSQAMWKFRTGRNDEGYTLGDEAKGTVWAAYNLTDSFSLSGRMEGLWWDDIRGEDRELNRNMVPTARADLRNGQRVDGLLGVNYYHSQEYRLEGNRVALEVGLPLYESLDGPQMSTDWRLMLGWQMSW